MGELARESSRAWWKVCAAILAAAVVWGVVSGLVLTTLFPDDAGLDVVVALVGVALGAACGWWAKRWAPRDE